MKLKQLQCVVAVAKNGFNVTAAAEKLHMSQPAVSKQIKLMEEELGLPVFRRNSKSFIGFTEIGEAIMPDIERILASVENILNMGLHYNPQALNQLTIATTNTLAHNRLVQILPAMQHEYTKLPMHIIEGTNTQNLQMVQEREADFAWFSASNLTPYSSLLRGLLMLPAESWSAVAIVPKDHPMNDAPFDGLTALEPYPLITYVTSHKEQSSLVRAMAARGLSARVVLTARNADMIKNYVRNGLGVGIIADMAFDQEKDSDLQVYPLERYLPPFNTYLVWHHEMRLRSYHYDLVGRIVPGATKDAIDQHIRNLQTDEDPGWVI